MMGFAGGEVLLVRRAWWQRLVEGHSVSAGGEGRVGDTQAADAMPTLGRPAPTYIRWCGLWPLSCQCEEGSVQGGSAEVLLDIGLWPSTQSQAGLWHYPLDG